MPKRKKLPKLSKQYFLWPKELIFQAAARMSRRLLILTILTICLGGSGAGGCLCQPAPPRQAASGCLGKAKTAILAVQLAQFPSDWKIYTNDHYGYQIHYPGTWHVREENQNTPGIPIRHILQHTDFSPAKDYDQPQNRSFFCSLIVWDNPRKLAIRDWLMRENPNHPALLAGRAITIANQQAIWHEPSGNASYVNVWLTNGSFTYQLFSCEPSGEQKYRDIFDLMLKSLRFKP